MGFFFSAVTLSSLTWTREKMSAVKIHSFITRRPGPAMYAFEFKVARALIQQNISGQIWIIYVPEISVKSVRSKGKKKRRANKNTKSRDMTGNLFSLLLLKGFFESQGNWGVGKQRNTQREPQRKSKALLSLVSCSPLLTSVLLAQQWQKSLWRRKLPLQKSPVGIHLRF